MSRPVSLQLETIELEIDGHIYPLRCNMAVLEKLQNGPGEGEIGKLLDMPSYQVVFEIAAAMIEEACEEDPELPEIPIARLKRICSPSALAKTGIFRMFTAAILPASPAGGNNEAVSGADTGNPETESPGN